MIKSRLSFEMQPIEPDPQGGWQLVVSVGDPFDYTTPNRPGFSPPPGEAFLDDQDP